MGGWSKLHIKELCDLYSLLRITGMIKVKEDEMGWACSTRGGEERCL
jgi:hypothetical protein